MLDYFVAKVAVRLSDNRPIGVFDSGLGGLTVVKELKKLLPNESIVYFGDTGRVPYGTRSDETILRYAREDEAFLLEQNVKLIVAACGTVSSVAYMTSEELPVPFIEVVNPAAESAVEATKTGRIGVIGTPATINSRAHARAVLKRLTDAVIVANACPLFVPLVEEGWIDADDEVTYNTAKRYLAPIIEGRVDTLILGCTHYPALEKVIANIMGDGVTLINMGTSVAQKVKATLESTNSFADKVTVDKYYVSDRAASFSAIAKNLLGHNIEECVEQVKL
ncbi:MAG: glutamate racemase [Clostridia bacterium]|nr:glutamate racemase [Clostridia bacterium]